MKSFVDVSPFFFVSFLLAQPFCVSTEYCRRKKTVLKESTLKPKPFPFQRKKDDIFKNLFQQ